MRVIRRYVFKGCNDNPKRYACRSLSFSKDNIEFYHKLDERERTEYVLKHFELHSSKNILDELSFANAFKPNLALSLICFRQDIEKISRMKNSIAFERTGALLESDSVAAKWLSQFYSADQLELRQVTFESSDPTTLGAVVEREKVLESLTISNLKQRLSNGRYIYGLFHKQIPHDPLVFVHVALTNNLTNSMSLIDQNVATEYPTYAIFYSISSSYNALKNIGLPQLLLRQVKQHLEYTIPTVHSFSTLSPIPGFMKWLESSKSRDNKFIPRKIQDSIGKIHENIHVKLGENELPIETLLNTLAAKPSVLHNPITAEQLKVPLQWLCAHYLSQETKRMSNGKVIPLDDVANFHLRNGASLFRINYMGDLSPSALKRSAGMMVNYLYSSNVHKPINNIPGFSMPVGPSIVEILRP